MAAAFVADVGREDSEAEAVGEEVWGRHEGDGDRHFDTAADAGFNAGGGEYLTILGKCAPGARDEQRDGHGVALQEGRLAAAAAAAASAAAAAVE